MFHWKFTCLSSVLACPLLCFTVHFAWEEEPVVALSRCFLVFQLLALLCTGMSSHRVIGLCLQQRKPTIFPECCQPGHCMFNKGDNHKAQTLQKGIFLVKDPVYVCLAKLDFSTCSVQKYLSLRSLCLHLWPPSVAPKGFRQPGHSGATLASLIWYSTSQYFPFGTSNKMKTFCKSFFP